MVSPDQLTLVGSWLYQCGIGGGRAHRLLLKNGMIAGSKSRYHFIIKYPRLR